MGVRVQEIADCGSVAKSPYKHLLVGLTITRVMGDDVTNDSFDDIIERIDHTPSPLLIEFEHKASSNRMTLSLNKPLGIILEDDNNDELSAIEVTTHIPAHIDSLIGLKVARVMGNDVTSHMFDEVITRINRAPSPLLIDFEYKTSPIVQRLSLSLEKPIGFLLEEFEDGSFNRGVFVKEVIKCCPTYVPAFRGSRPLLGLKVTHIMGEDVKQASFEDIIDKIKNAPSPVLIDFENCESLNNYLSFAFEKPLGLIMEEVSEGKAKGVMVKDIYRGTSSLVDDWKEYNVWTHEEFTSVY